MIQWGKDLKKHKIQHEAFKVDFLNIKKNVEIVGEEILVGKSNYFVGNDPDKWHTNINQYSKVRYKEIYAGIDLILYSKDDLIEYDFIVSPGADLNQITMQFKGIQNLDIDKNGNLLIKMQFGVIQHNAPVIYQKNEHRKTKISGSYEILDKNTVRFHVENYNKNKELIIDPVLGYSTYLGGLSNDSATSIAVDLDGNAYIGGGTESLNFPTTMGAYISEQDGGGFITKLNNLGTEIIYSTFLGTGAYAGIEVDELGNVYVAGSTYSTIHPTTANAYQLTSNGGVEIYISKLNSSGNALLYSTYLGGNSDDFV